MWPSANSMSRAAPGFTSAARRSMAPSADAHQGKAARQHILIAQRLEQLGLAVELARARARATPATVRVRRRGRGGSAGRGRIRAARTRTIWGLSRRRAPLEPVAMRPRIGDAARASGSPLAVSKRWRGRSRILALRGSPRASPANLWRSTFDPAPERGRDAQAVLRHGDEQARRAPARRARRRRSASARGNRRRSR